MKASSNWRSSWRDALPVPGVAEFLNTWIDLAPRLGSRTLMVDISDVTYADERGKQVLKQIYVSTRAEFITSTALTQFIAEEVATNRTINAEGAD